MAYSLFLTEESYFTYVFFFFNFFSFRVFLFSRSIFLGLLFRFWKQFLGRDINSALLIDLHDLDFDDIAKLEDIFRFVYSFMFDLGDM